jgi:hypothetical protein
MDIFLSCISTVVCVFLIYSTFSRFVESALFYLDSELHIRVSNAAGEVSEFQQFLLKGSILVDKIN